MCGIVGFQGDFSASRIEKSLEIFSHRGPDSSGITFFDNGRVGLGHVRLSIIDLTSAGHQPMFDEATKNSIVFNGEIYNHKTLRLELLSLGFTFKTQSDTEVLLKMYEAFGEDMLNRLNGDFAFAIFDTKKSQFFIARDRLGVKPLYYYASEKGLCFASEIKSLLPFFNEQPEFDLVSIDRHLNFLWCPGNVTALKNVYKLGPGEAIIVSGNAITKRWRWFSSDFKKEKKLNTDPKILIKQAQEHLQTAVSRQMMADVPIGAFLSGGLDSSAIVAFAKCHKPDIECFTINFEGSNDPGDVNDLPYAGEVASHLGVELNVVDIAPSTVLDDVHKMIWHLDEPVADLAALNTLYICGKARDQGIKVMLSGTGGDDIFTGYRRHKALNILDYLDILPQKISQPLRHSSSYLSSNIPIFRKLKKFLQGAGLPENEKIIKYFFWLETQQIRDLYSSEFLFKLDGVKPERPLLDFIIDNHEFDSNLDKMLAIEQRFFLADHNLNYTDKMAMAVGVEARVPFLDVDLVNFANSLPDRYKQRGLAGKWILKQAMKPFLPRNVIFRPKAGFGVPLRRWIKFELRDLVGEYLSSTSVLNRGVFKNSAIENLLESNEKGFVDGAYTIFSLVCFEVWCRKFIDQES